MLGRASPLSIIADCGVSGGDAAGAGGAAVARGAAGAGGAAAAGGAAGTGPPARVSLAPGGGSVSEITGPTSRFLPSGPTSIWLFWLAEERRSTVPAPTPVFRRI